MADFSSAAASATRGVAIACLVHGARHYTGKTRQLVQQLRMRDRDGCCGCCCVASRRCLCASYATTCVIAIAIAVVVAATRDLTGFSAPTDEWTTLLSFVVAVCIGGFCFSSFPDDFLDMNRALRKINTGISIIHVDSDDDGDDNAEDNNVNSASAERRAAFLAHRLKATNVIAVDTSVAAAVGDGGDHNEGDGDGLCREEVRLSSVETTDALTRVRQFCEEAATKRLMQLLADRRENDSRTVLVAPQWSDGFGVRVVVSAFLTKHARAGWPSLRRSLENSGARRLSRTEDLAVHLLAHGSFAADYATAASVESPLKRWFYAASGSSQTLDDDVLGAGNVREVLEEIAECLNGDAEGRHNDRFADIVADYDTQLREAAKRAMDAVARSNNSSVDDNSSRDESDAASDGESGDDTTDSDSK